MLSDFILDIAARHPHVPCFHIRLPFAEYDHLTKVLDKEITTTVNKTQKLWVAPLHGAVQFSVQKPKPRDFQEGQWCPQQCVQQLRYVRSTDCEERVPQMPHPCGAHRPRAATSTSTCGVPRVEPAM